VYSVYWEFVIVGRRMLRIMERGVPADNGALILCARIWEDDERHCDYNIATYRN